MNREEQRKVKEAKKLAEISRRMEKREEERESRNWQKMVIRWKAIGAWIEDKTPSMAQSL